MKSLNKKNKGITLIELVLTLAILGIVTTIIFSMNLFGLRSFALSEKSAENQFETRMPTDFLAKELRYADSIRILSSVPASPAAGAHQIYLESGQLVYKEYGAPSVILGTTGVSDYTFIINKKAGTSNIISFTIGKDGTSTFDLTTDVIALNLDRNGIIGDASGIYVEFFTDNADSITPVSITGLNNPPNKFVTAGNPVSMPLRVTASMSNSTTRQVSVRWSPSTINTSAPGIYTSTGRVVGYSGSVNFTVIVGDEEDFEIYDIPPIEIIIEKGQTFVMPNTVPAIYTDGLNTFDDDVEVVSWSEIITSDVVGEFLSEGTVDGYESMVELKVTVHEPVTIISIPHINETTNQGVTFSLPTEVSANMSNGTTQMFPVTWNPPATIDTMSYGTKDIIGYVHGYDSPIIFTLTVVQRKIPTPKIIAIKYNGNSGSGDVTVLGLAGAEAKLYSSDKEAPIGNGTIGENQSVKISVKNGMNQLHRVILTKDGWRDSDPYYWTGVVEKAD